MTPGNQDIKEQVYRKLFYFYENKEPIHFCLVNRGWKNGEIIDLNYDKKTLVIKEFKEGVLPFLLEDIDVKTIEAYKKRGENDNAG